MKPISIPMFGNSLAVILGLLVLATPTLARNSADDSPHLGSLATYDREEFRGIVEDRCIVCHERQMVVEAVRTENLADMKLHLLEKDGPLGEEEEKVLGIFWGEPLRQKAEPAQEGPYIGEEDYHEFRQILKSRCTGCHPLGRVERAMTQQQSAKTVIEKMQKRGAILSDREIGIIRKFWGQDKEPR